MQLRYPLVIKKEEPVAIIRQDTSRAEAVIEAVIKLDRTMASNAFESAELFAEIVDGDYVHADHCDSLKDFLKKHGFELSLREIDYRVNVSKKSKKLGLTREQQLKAGISKMKSICTLNPDTEVVDEATGSAVNVANIMRDLVAEAGAGTSLKDIVARVKELKGVSEGEDSVLEWLNIPTFASRKEFITETIEKAKRHAGDTVDQTTKEAKDISTATAIELVFANFSADPNYQDEVGEPGTFHDENVFADDEQAAD